MRKTTISEHARELAKRGAAKGGQARATALSQEQRREAARKAAASRWGTDLAKETHGGILPIGSIPCAVLSNGKRVLSTGGVSRAFGSAKKSPAMPAAGGAPQPPAFLAAANLQSFISADLKARIGSPLAYRPKRGGRIAYGYEAEPGSLIPVGL